MRNKKGMDAGAIVAIVIVLIVILTMSFFSYRLFKISEETKQKRICKESLRVQAATKIKGDDTWKLIFFDQNKKLSDVPCPVMYKELPSGISPDQAKEELALMMFDSWDTMHKGELELFESNLGKETYCILTHHIKFMDKTSELTDFGHYLDTHTTPKGDMNYSQYLRCFNPTPDLFEAASASSADDTIDTSQDYGIMFVYAKEGHLQKVWAGVKGAITGGVGGSIAGAATVLLLIPEPTITKFMFFVVVGASTGATGLGTTGYLLGSEKSADWQACVMLFPYNDQTLSNLDCTYMAGVQGNRIE